MAALGNNTPYHVGYLCVATHPLKKARRGVFLCSLPGWASHKVTSSGSDLPRPWPYSVG